MRIDRITPSPAPLLASGSRLVAPRCHRADSSLARLVGLLATPDLGRDEALWLEPCRSVHGMGLRAPVGCAFLDADGGVLRVVDPLPRWRVRGVRRARAVVECSAGVLAGVTVGDRLALATAAGGTPRERGVKPAPPAPLGVDGRVAAGAGPTSEGER